MTNTIDREKSSQGIIGRSGTKQPAIEYDADALAREAEYLPGTLAAIAKQCSCSILANRFGAGAVDLPLDEHGQAQYWVDASCPLHSSTTLTASNAPIEDALQDAPRVTLMRGPATELEGWLCVALVVTSMAWVVVVLILLL